MRQKIWTAVLKYKKQRYKCFPRATNNRLMRASLFDHMNENEVVGKFFGKLMKYHSEPILWESDKKLYHNTFPNFWEIFGELSEKFSVNCRSFSFENVCDNSDVALLATFSFNTH